MHRITTTNQEEALSAVRDILLMFTAMAKAEREPCDVVQKTIKFDPLRFVDSEVADDCLIDGDLLRTGSAIALLCRLQGGQKNNRDMGGHTLREASAITSGRLRGLPDIEAVAAEASKRIDMPADAPWFDEAFQPLRKKYVLGFFKRMAAGEDHAV